jgi:hypothetical protein
MRKYSFLLVIAVFVIALVPNSFAQDDMMMGPDVIVTLGTTPLAENVGLQDVTGWAHVVSDEGRIHISLTLDGVALPEGTVLEGWVVDAGLNGGPGETHVSDADEVYGTPFGDASFDEAVEAAPYALSTGVLTVTEDGTWDVIFNIPNYNFSAYNAVVVTAESDGNSTMGFDPRPGTPVFIGLIADGEPAGDMMGHGDEMMSEDDDDMMSEDDDEMMSEDDDDMMSDDDDEMMSEDDDDMMSDDDMMMGDAIEVVLDVTPLAENANLAGITATAQVYVDSAVIEITVELNGAELPEGAVLEGWVVDAGLNGGPGTTNVTDADEVAGPPFGEPAFDELVESAPYALSTGVLHSSMDMDGTMALSFHVPAYNFSPYDAVVITLESDGNTTMGFDPRPGTPVLVGAIDMMMDS